METTNLDLWGGVECTINRVGDRYFNQLQRSGHCDRLQDLRHFAGFGLKTLRTPLLWEALAPVAVDQIEWRWSDRWMAEIQSLGIQPVAGLLHHGSGPRYTDLLDPEFPQKFARYAAGIARRYPWIEFYTPINEPLTTARFSALYGHWYPHKTDDRSFARAFLNQIKAIVLAMKAIREVNPSARLVQTEDLGRVFSTPDLAYQADFENNRRWATWDLLRGEIKSQHPLWSYFEWAGVSAEELDFFSADPCPPDLIGINYYVTSDRYLDENLEFFPPETHGGNGRQTYADDAAVRARIEGIAGAYCHIIETWHRYRTPVALTEVHLGCTLDEQLRWFMEMWRACVRARNEDCDVRAMTVWALLGSYDWDVLVTHQNGTYEPGAFDLRSGSPRPTAIASAIRELTQGRSYYHPALDTDGWWRRPSRLRAPLELNGTESTR